MIDGQVVVSGAWTLSVDDVVAADDLYGETLCILQGACSSTQDNASALKCAAHTTSQQKTCYGLCSY